MAAAKPKYFPNCHFPFLFLAALFFFGPCYASAISFSTLSDSLRADSILTIADSLNNNNRRSEAIELASQAQQIFKEAGLWSGVIISLNKIARYYDYMENTAKSRQYVDQAENTASQYLHLDHPIMGSIWQLKGELFIQANELDSALLSFDHASTIYRNDQYWYGLAWSDALAALVCYYQLDFKKMEEYLDKAAITANEQLDKENDFFETLFQFQALLYSETGEYTKALSTAEAAVNHRLRIGKNNYDDSTFLAVDYINLGTINHDLGDYDQAIHYYKLAAAIQTATKVDITNTAINYINLGVAYQRSEQHKEAISSYKKSLSLLTNDESPNATRSLIDCYLGLARNFNELQQLDSSEYYLDQIVAFKKDNEFYDYNRDLVYFNLALVRKKQSAFEEAKELTRKGLKENKRLFGKLNIRSSSLPRTIGDICFVQDSFSAALRHYQFGLKILCNNLDPNDYYSNPKLDEILHDIRVLPYLQAKARALLALDAHKNRLAAFSNYELAIELIDRMRSNFETEGSKQLLSSQAYSIYEEAIDLAHQLHQVSGDAQYINKAFLYSEKSKALLLLEALVAQSENNNSRIFQLSDSLLQQEKVIKARLIFYQRKISNEQAKGEDAQTLKINNWTKELAEYRSRYEALRSSIRKEDPNYFRLKYELELASPASIRQQLLKDQQHTAFIEYFSGQEQLFSFIITADDFKMYRLPLDTSLNKAIDQLQYVQSINPTADSSLTVAEHFQQYAQSAHLIYKRLLKGMIPDGIKRLILVPDGRLGYLSFDLLLSQPAKAGHNNYSSSQLQYLIEDYQLSYGYSGSLLLESMETIAKKAVSPYGGFAPYTGAASGFVARNRSCSEDQLGKLPNSERSVKTVRQLLGGKLFLGAEASKANFLEHAANFELLHLSTHACVDDTDPLFNRIYFSDGHLSTYELYRLQLNAGLVVLSACETGTGQLVHGEGIMSLARGFMQSGCPSIVTSLWNANDYSTTEIMIDFFGQLRQGIEKDAALRTAKLNYLENAPSRLSLPYFWATFIHIGHNAPLDHSQFPWGWGLLGIGILAVLVFWLVKKFR